MAVSFQDMDSLERWIPKIIEAILATDKVYKPVQWTCEDGTVIDITDKIQKIIDKIKSRN